MAEVGHKRRCDDFCSASLMQRLPNERAMNETTGLRETVQ
jgi:predicted TIM-barrel enzyme